MVAGVSNEVVWAYKIQVGLWGGGKFIKWKRRIIGNQLYIF